MWQAIESKAKAIKSLLRRNVTARSIEDADTLVLSAGEAKALASGNPDVMKAVQTKNDIQRLQMVRASHKDGQLRAKQSLDRIPKMIESDTKDLAQLKQHLAIAEKHDKFEAVIGRKTFADKEKTEAGEALLETLAKVPTGSTTRPIGKVRGFTLRASNNPDGFRLILQGDGDLEHVTAAIPQEDATAQGLPTRIDNLLKSIPTKIAAKEKAIAGNKSSLVTFEDQLNKPFAEAEKLQRLQAELTELERKLQKIEDLEPETSSDLEESEGIEIGTASRSPRESSGDFRESSFASPRNRERSSVETRGRELVGAGVSSRNPQSGDLILHEKEFRNPNRLDFANIETSGSRTNPLKTRKEIEDEIDNIVSTNNDSFKDKSFRVRKGA